MLWPVLRHAFVANPRLNAEGGRATLLPPARTRESCALALCCWGLGPPTHECIVGL